MAAPASQCTFQNHLGFLRGSNQSQEVQVSYLLGHHIQLKQHQPAGADGTLVLPHLSPHVNSDFTKHGNVLPMES